MDDLWWVVDDGPEHPSPGPEHLERNQTAPHKPATPRDSPDCLRFWHGHEQKTLVLFCLPGILNKRSATHVFVTRWGLKIELFILLLLFL